MELSRTVWAIGGCSGQGKTTCRSGHWLLKELEIIDIADEYTYHGATTWQEARDQFNNRIKEALENSNDSFVLEAAFDPSNNQQRNLVSDAICDYNRRTESKYKVNLKFIWLWEATKREIIKRIKSDIQKDEEVSETRNSARLNFAQNARDYWFTEIAGEGEDQLPKKPLLSLPRQLSDEEFYRSAVQYSNESIEKNSTKERTVYDSDLDNTDADHGYNNLNEQIRILKGSISMLGNKSKNINANHDYNNQDEVSISQMTRIHQMTEILYLNVLKLDDRIIRLETEVKSWPLTTQSTFESLSDLAAIVKELRG